MKYLAYFIVLVTGFMITRCIGGLEDPDYTEFYEYLTLINCDGSEKVHLTKEDNPGKVFFYNNDQKIIYARGDDEIISFDISTLQSEIIFPLVPEELDMFGYDFFQEFEKIIFWDKTTERDIHIATIETGEIENLTNTLDIWEGSVKLSPTEEYFAYIENDFTYGDSIKWSIKYRNFDGSTNETVKSTFAGVAPELRYLDWISNEKIMYSCSDSGNIPGIYAINLDGSENQLIYEGYYQKFSMCEDRTKVVFEDDNEIYLIDTSDYSVSYLVSDSKPVISPDGNKLAYYDGISGLVVWDMIEDIITLISETPDSPAIGFSSDSQKLVFNENISITYHRDRELM
jgi:hypothetical protein